MPEIDTDPVVQRVVSAADAPRPLTTGASSVFAMAAAPAPQSTPAPASKPDRRRAIRGMAAQCVLTLGACGPLTVVQLAKGTGLTVQQVRDVCTNGVTRGYLGKQRGDAGMAYFAMPGAVESIEVDAAGEQPRTGFKGWLERQGKASAEGRAPRKRPAAPAPAAPVALPGWRWGVFNDGALVIEIEGNDALELSAEQARSLKTFLAQMYPEA